MLKMLFRFAKMTLKSIKSVETAIITGYPILLALKTFWILQHLLIPRIQWLLLIYEIPVSLAFKLEQKVSGSIRKWLHLHHLTSTIFSISVSIANKKLIITTKSFKNQWAFTFKISSQDSLVSGCIPKLQTATWEAKDAFSFCENDIKINQVCGNSYHNSLSHFTGTQNLLDFTAPTHSYDPMASPNLRNTNFFSF